MLNKKETLKAIQIMGKTYPTVGSSLVADSPYHFLMAVMLSAQTTDKAVNLVTPKLFKRFTSPQQMKDVAVKEVESYIKTIGLYRNKAKYLISCSKQLIENFGGQVPKNHKDLMSLTGVGRKTADVVLAECFNIPAIAVDTHVFRISKRLEIVNQDATLLETEKTLMEKLPENMWIIAHHRMITWGRKQCGARNPKCEDCPLLFMCHYGKEKIK